MKWVGKQVTSKLWKTGAVPAFKANPASDSPFGYSACNQLSLHYFEIVVVCDQWKVNIL